MSVMAGLLMIAAIAVFLIAMLTIFDTIEQFGDELHDYFEEVDE